MVTTSTCTYLLHLLPPVPSVAMRHVAIVLAPYQLWRAQEGRNSELVLGSRVIPVVLGDHVLEVGDGLHD